MKCVQVSVVFLPLLLLFTCWSSIVAVHSDGVTKVEFIQAMFTGVELREVNIESQVETPLLTDRVNRLLGLTIQQPHTWPERYLPPKSVAVWQQGESIKAVFGTENGEYAEEKLMRYFRDSQDQQISGICFSYINEQTEPALSEFFNLDRHALTIEVLWVFDEHIHISAIMDLMMAGYNIRAWKYKKIVELICTELHVHEEDCNALKKDLNSKAIKNRDRVTKKIIRNIRDRIALWKNTVAAMFSGVLLQKGGQALEYREQVDPLLEILLDRWSGPIPDGLEDLEDKISSPSFTHNIAILPNMVMAFMYNNEGNLEHFRSTKGNNWHAEDYLLDAYDPQDIEELLISYSPCVHCTPTLIEVFSEAKPTIKILWVYGPYPQGVRELVAAGFEIQLWKHGDYQSVFNYICKNYDEVEYFLYYKWCSTLLQAMSSGALEFRDGYTQKRIKIQIKGLKKTEF